MTYTLTYTFAVFIWLALLALAYPYVRRAKHPREGIMAAYLLFVTLFSAVGALSFLVIIWLITQAGSGRLLHEPFGTVTLLALVLVPAFLIARSQIRRPPSRQPPLE